MKRRTIIGLIIMMLMLTASPCCAAKAQTGGAVSFSANLSFISSVVDEDLYQLEQVPDNTSLSKYILSSSEKNYAVLISLIYLTLFIIWLGISARRMIDGLQRNLFWSAGLTMVIWICVYALRLGVRDQVVFSTYLRLSYLPLSFAMNTFMFLLAVAIDDTESFLKRRKTTVILFSVINLAVISFVFTNSLHGLILKPDLSPDGYLFGPGYYVVVVVTEALLAGAFIIMSKKAAPGSKKPIGWACAVVLVAGCLYTACFITGLIPFKLTDVSIGVGYFFLIFCELCMRAGLIPRSRKYTKLFSHSPLKLQIADKEGRVVMMSQQAIPVSKRVFTYLANGDGEFFDKRSNTMYYMTKINGGSVIWQEDVNSLVLLNKRIDMNIRLLESSNKILAMQRDLLAKHGGTRAKKKLLDSLDADLNSRYETLISMIDDLPDKLDKKLEVARITLLLVYIKRRSNLFFREIETNLLPADEIVVYIDELAEFAKFTGVIMLTSSSLGQDIPVNKATLIYDLLYAVVKEASLIGQYNVVEQLGVKESGKLELGLLLSEFVDDVDSWETDLREKIAEENGVLNIRLIDDLVSITLAFKL